MSVKIASIDSEALGLPAPFVDQFQVTNLGGTLVRVSFAEALDQGKGHYRAAVMMQPGVARQVALTILNILGPLPPVRR